MATTAVLPVTAINTHAEINKIAHTEKWVYLGELAVPEYQRPVSFPRVKEMAEHFDVALLERILCNQRPHDEKIYIVDGQHRVKMLELIGWSKAPIALHVGWTMDQERERFSYLNSPKGRRGLSALDLHRAGGARERQMDEVLKRVGIELVGYAPQTVGEHATKTSAIGSLHRIFDAEVHGGKEGLYKVLWLCKKTWATQPGVLSGNMLEGVHHFWSYAQFDRGWNEDRFIKALENHTPNSIMRDAQATITAAIAGRRRMPRLIAQQLYNWYNYGARGESRLSFQDYTSVMSSAHRALGRPTALQEE
jgi:hypothetical protein